MQSSRRSNMRRAGSSPFNGIHRASSRDSFGSYSGKEGADLNSAVAATFERQHPFRHEVSPAERRKIMFQSGAGRTDEGAVKPDVILRSMSLNMDELSSRLHDLQRGQDDIHSWVQQIHHNITRDVQVGSDAPESRDTPGVHVGNPKSSTAVSEHGSDSPKLEDSFMAVGERSTPGVEPGQPTTRTLTLDVKDAYQSEDGASHKYCGFALRKELVDLRENVHHEGTLDGLMSETAMPMYSAKLRRTESELSNRQQRRHLQFLPKVNAIHPDSVLRLWLDVGCMMVLLFDSISVPYQLSFDPDTLSGFWFLSNWLTLGVWTADIFIGFITGYYDQGGPVLSLRKIAAHYIRTFFFIDLTTIACDWISILLTMLMESSSASNVMLLKLFRLLKLNRLLRLIGALQSGKFGQMYDRIINWSRQLGFDHQLHFFLNVLQLMFAILWLNHIGCCLWFSIQTNAVGNWESSSNIEAFYKTTGSSEWEYLLGFYWAMTSMVSGASIMSPTNVGELVFTILYVLFGLLVGSTLISSLAAMLLDLQMSNKEQRDNVRLLRQYLFQQGLEVGLALDVEKEVVARMSKEKRLGAAEVPCLGLLSPAMRSALHYAIYCRPLKAHPFLGVCHVLDSTGLFTKEICEDAIDHDTQLPGFQLFPTPQLGDLCEGPFYIVLGELEYRVKETDFGKIGAASNVPDLAVSPIGPSSLPASPGHRSTLVSAGHWLCELACWLQWSHRGSLNACIPCEYLRLNAAVLLKLFSHFEDLRWLAWQYATSLCKAVDAEELEQLTDLPLREDLHESVVLSMKPEGRRQMSAAPLKMLKAAARNKQSGWLPFSRAPFAELLDQVDQGKCDLVMKGGQVMRIVSVVALRLEREVVKGGQSVRQILAQISKSTKAEDAKCQLPGGKVRAGELPSEALERLLQEQLQALMQAGVRIADLQKVDNVVELVEEAMPGDRALGVSSFADLHISSLIQISGDRQSETRVVLSLDPASRRIEIDTPLERSYDIGTRVTKAGEIKKKMATSSGKGFGVDTKYIRTVFCGSLGVGDQVGKVLRRDRREPEMFDSEALEHDPTPEYCALLLLPGQNMAGIRSSVKSANTFASRANIGADRDSGIVCAWIDEKDFVSLSTKDDGVDRVMKWVDELQASIRESAGEEYCSRLLEPIQDAQLDCSSGPLMLPLPSIRSQSVATPKVESRELIPGYHEPRISGIAHASEGSDDNEVQTI